MKFSKPCAALLLAYAAQAQAACASGSTTVFACTTAQGKAVEVCDAGATLSYRFGKPSAPAELELKVPRAQASTTQWAGVGSSISYSVEIPNGKTVYSVFTSMDRMSAKHEFVAGINVHSDGKVLATVKCSPRTVVHALEGIKLPATQW